MLIIYKATAHPVSFEKNDYIRIGSYTKKLRDYPEIQWKLWDKLRNRNFENEIAIADLELPKVLGLLDYSVYFDLNKEVTRPTDIDGVAHYLSEDGIINKQDDGSYSITNLGAILLAKRISDFPRLSRKAIRVVQYEGNMTPEDRIRACYFHACIRFIQDEYMTNQSLRERFGLPKSSSASISRLIKDAMENKLIKPLEPNTAPRYMKYIPYWG